MKIFWNSYFKFFSSNVFFVEIFIISFFFLLYPIFHPVFHVWLAETSAAVEDDVDLAEAVVTFLISYSCTYIVSYPCIYPSHKIHIIHALSLFSISYLGKDWYGAPTEHGIFGRIEFSQGRWITMVTKTPKLMKQHVTWAVGLVKFFFHSLLWPWESLSWRSFWNLCIEWHNSTLFQE